GEPPPFSPLSPPGRPKAGLRRRRGPRRGPGRGGDGPHRKNVEAGAPAAERRLQVAWRGRERSERLSAPPRSGAPPPARPPPAPPSSPVPRAGDARPAPPPRPRGGGGGGGAPPRTETTARPEPGRQRGPCKPRGEGASAASA